MSRETMYRKSAYKYHLDPKNPCVIERKLNRPYARWKSWRLFDSQTEARIALIKLGKDTSGQETPQP